MNEELINNNLKNAKEFSKTENKYTQIKILKYER